MNKTIKQLKNRFSVRRFTEDQIDDDILHNIIDAGLHSASAGNLQPYTIIKIRDKMNSMFFVEQGMQKFIGSASVNLLFCLDFHRLKRWSRLHKAPFVMDKSFRHFWVGFEDVMILAQSIETAANSYGIGSCYIGTTLERMREIQDKFKLPKGVIPIILLSMGYPDVDQKIAKKLRKDIVVHDEHYQEHTDEYIQYEYYLKYGEPNMKLSTERKMQILKVIEEVGDKDYINEVKEYFNNIDKVSMPMRYFGLHYAANYMAAHNSDILSFLYENGCIWAKGEDYPIQNEKDT